MPSASCSQKCSQYKTGVNYPKILMDTPIILVREGVFTLYIYNNMSLLNNTNSLSAILG